jgi:hypothetical protein
MKPGPRRNVPLWIATSAVPVVMSESVSAPAAAACRRVTTARRLVMPATMMAASRTRAATKPSAGREVTMVIK